MSLQVRRRPQPAGGFYDCAEIPGRPSSDNPWWGLLALRFGNHFYCHRCWWYVGGIVDLEFIFKQIMIQYTMSGFLFWELSCFTLPRSRLRQTETVGAVYGQYTTYFKQTRQPTVLTIPGKASTMAEIPNRFDGVLFS